MGILNRIRHALGEVPSDTSNDSEVEDLASSVAEEVIDEENAEAGDGMGISFDMDAPDRVLPREDLQSLVETHYDVNSGQAELLTNAILKGHEEGWGYDKTARHADREDLGLPREQIKTVVWNETHGIRLRHDAIDKRESSVLAGVKWMLPGDGDSSPVCQATAAEIEERGGSVSVDTLQDIFQEKAEMYEDGMPERVEHWVVHDRCRCSMLPVTS